MLEYNVYNLVLVPAVCIILYTVCSCLRKHAECRNLSSRIPSVTKSFWSEIQFLWTLSTMRHKDILPFFSSALKKCGPIVHYSIFGKSYVLLNDPNDVKVLLNSTQNLSKGSEYVFLKPWLNESLLLSTGPKWQARRKLLTNTFHIKTVNTYNPSINKHSRMLTKRLLEASERNKEICILNYVRICAVNMICETIMGCDRNAEDDKTLEYAHSVESVSKLVVERIFKFWLWNDLIFKISASGRLFYKAVDVLHEFTDNIINTKRETLKDSKNQKVQSEDKWQAKSVLDLLLDISGEHSDQITEKDIHAEVDMFLFAGHDSTSSSMTMTLLLLGMNPDIQDKVRDELVGIFGDSDRNATIDDLKAMRYLEAVIKESLRIYPSLLSYTREISTTLTLKDHVIPPKTMVAIYPYFLHRNESIYPDPEKFVPERFLDGDNKSKFVFAYLPYSAGSRNCIAQKYSMSQMKAVLSTVIRKVKFETLGTKEDIRIEYHLVVGIESIPKMKFYAI